MGGGVRGRVVVREGLPIMEHNFYERGYLPICMQLVNFPRDY